MRRTLFSLFGGVLFAGLLSLIPAASAECGGMCPDWLSAGGTAYAYAGCRIQVNSQLQIVGGTCYYTEAGPAGGGCSTCAE